MNTVISSDGTTIAFDRKGEGPPLVLIDGAFGHRRFGPISELAAALAPRFTVYTYDRRGRGDSTDTSPYAVDREIEDLEALVKQAGGSAFVYGHSSGAALALEAVTQGVPITKLALYEAPYIVDDSRPPLPPDYQAHLGALLADDRRGGAVKLFMKNPANVPPVIVTMMGLMGFLPFWSKLKAVAHTLPYDAAIMEHSDVGHPAVHGGDVTVPTLVMGGAKSPPWLRNAVNTVAHAIPAAQQRTLPGQTHNVKASAVAPVLAEFLTT